MNPEDEPRRSPARRALLDPDGKWTRWVLIAAALLGFAWGGWVRPLWHEMAELGQLRAGLVSYAETNYLAEMHAREPTLQTAVPGMLLLAGAPEWRLSRALSALVTALSFTAWAAMVLLLSASPLLAVLSCLLFLDFPYSHAHFYPLVYPIFHYIFGQVGTYAAVLALALFGLDWTVLCGLVFGFLPGLHLPWGLATWIGVGATAACTDWRPSRRFLTSAAVSFALAGCLTVGGRQVLEPVTRPLPRELPAEVGELPELDLDYLEEYREKGPPRSQAIDPPVERHRRPWQIHNQLLRDQASPVRAGFDFLRASLEVIGLVAGLVWLWPGYLTRGRRRLLVAVAAIAFTAVCYQLIQEIDPSFGWLRALHPKLPPLLLRAAVQRWLNLCAVLAPMLALATSWLAAVRSRSWPEVLVALVALVWPAWYLVPAGLSLGLTSWRRRSAPATGEAEGRRLEAPLRVLLLGAALVLGAHLHQQTSQGSAYRDQLRRDRYGAAAKVLQGRSSEIVVAPPIWPSAGFNVQLRARRSVYYTSDLAVVRPGGGPPLPLYCFDASRTDVQGHFEAVTDCFEERPRDEWAWLGHFLDFEDVLVPATMDLDLPRRYEGDGVRIYQVPDLTAAAVRRLHGGQASEPAAGSQGDQDPEPSRSHPQG